MTVKLLDTLELGMEIVNDVEYSDIVDIKLDNANYLLKTFVHEYELRYKTEIKAISSIGERTSWYGAIGGNGQDVGVASETIDFAHLLSGCEDFKIQINDNKTLTIVKHDHDGSNYMNLVLLTNKEVANYYQNEYDYFGLAEYAYELRKQPTTLFGTIIESIEQNTVNIV
ncbi:MAG: hypothetical protein E7J02_12180 [Staphylococcus warneri]|nr:hypothetical protein [Staphylococcus warneri]